MEKMTKKTFKEKWPTIANIQAPLTQEFYDCVRCANCCKIIFPKMSEIFKCHQKGKPILCKECEDDEKES